MTAAQIHSRQVAPEAGGLVASRPSAAEHGREANPILHLQRTVGNQAVQRLVQAGVQPLDTGSGNRATEQLLTAEGDGRLHRCGPVPCNCSLEERLAKEGPATAWYDGLPVSHPAEPAEREADEVADGVMRMRDDDPPVHIGPTAQGALHRCAEDTADAHAGTAEVGPEAGQNTGLAAGIARQTRGGGQALDGGVRQFMEARFGRDLGHVQVHTDAIAGRLARQADAHAFTVGRHVFFGSDRYRPDDHAGRRLLAHELTHVVQQIAAGLAPAVVQRQARPGSQPPAAPAPVPAEKTSSMLEQAYRRLGDHRRAAAIRMCRESGGGSCSLVLTQAELRKLYELAQRSGGDQGKVRAGLPTAAPAALGVVPPVPALAGTLTPGLPPAAPVPPFPAPPVPTPPVGAPGYPTWAPPPPVAAAPGAAVGGAAVSSTAVAVAAAAAVTVLVLACVVVAVEAWQLSKFQHELEAKGFIVLDDALQKCIRGCHTAGEAIRPLPEFDFPPLRPLRPFPELPFPGRPFPVPDIEIGGPRRPQEPDDEGEEREDRRKERRRRKDPSPDVDIDPRTGERRRPEDPCDIIPIASCGERIKTYAEAEAELNKPPGSTMRGRQTVSTGDCFTDDVPRGKDDPLGKQTVHETWYTPGGDRVGTIKCCPCCIRGTGVVVQHCSVIF